MIECSRGCTSDGSLTKHLGTFESKTNKKKRRCFEDTARAIYFKEKKKMHRTTGKMQMIRFHLEAATPPSDILHLANRGRLSVPDIFFY